MLDALKIQIETVIELRELLDSICASDLHAARKRKMQVQIAEKEKELESYKEFKSRLIDALNEDLIDKDEFITMRDKYRRLESDCNAAIEALCAKLDELDSNDQNWLSWIEEYLKFQDLTTLTREAVVSLIDRITVYSDKRIKITFNYRSEIAYYTELVSDRPGIKKLLELVTKDAVGTIIVRDLSRFARNYLEAGHYLEFVFPAHDVRFISINDGYDSDEYGEATAGLHIAIKNLINQMYSSDISRKIKSAVDIKKLNGEFVYGTAPYGYKKGSERNKIVVDEKAAVVVKRIFSMACEGKKITEICRILNGEGIETPSVYLASVRGKYKSRSFWTYESVRNILGNRIYTGDTEPFKSHVVKVGSNHLKHISEAERIVIPDTHEAIISREDYFQAKQAVKGNVKSPAQGRASVLSSYLVCGCCGNKLVKGKKENKTFFCTSARYSPDSDCAKIRCDEEKMKNIVLRAIKQQCMMMESDIRLIRSAAKKRRSEADTLKGELRSTERLLESIRDEKMKLYEDFASGRFTKEEYLAKKDIQKEKERSTAEQITLLEEKLRSALSGQVQERNISEACGMIDMLSGVTELDDELMEKLIKRIIVFGDDSISIVWNFRNSLEEKPCTIVGKF